MKIRVRRLSFGGVRVLFKTYTPDAGKLSHRVAFVTSPLGDVDSWDALCRIMAGMGCLCVSIELPGYGHSAQAAPQDNKTRAQILWGVLDEVEISRGEEACRWHLISHGSACGAVLEMTRQEPKSVISRVLITPVTRGFGFTQKPQRLSSPRAWVYRQLYAWFTGREARFAAKLKKLYGGDLDQTRVNALYKQALGQGRMENLMEHQVRGYYISKAAFKTKAPVMILWGRDDPMGALYSPLINCLLHPDECYDRPNDTEPTRAECRRLDVEPHNMKFRRHMPMETDPKDVSERLSGWLDYAASRNKG